MMIGWKAILPLAAVCAAGSTAALADSTVDPSEDAFAPMQRYAISYDEPREFGKFYLRQYDISPYDADFEQLPHAKNPDMRVLLVTVDGMSDATVQGIQFRLGLARDGRGWKAVEAGMRRKCQSGEYAGKWTKGVCP